METSCFLYRSVIRIALALVYVFSVGCHHQQPVKAAKTACKGDHTDCDTKKKDINVDPNTGVREQDVCVCGGDIVEWKEGNHPDFRVQFKGNSPFADDDKVFYHGHAISQAAKELTNHTVFEYKIEVGTSTFDPRIIGGGGH